VTGKENMSKKTKRKKGLSFFSGEKDVTYWRLGKGCQMVPAVEHSLITVVKFPVNYRQDFNYGPELLSLRGKRTIELGWDNTSFNLPRPPIVIDNVILLSRAIKSANATLDRFL